LVSKAAALVAGKRLSELIPELVAAFERFLADPVKSDPQCWAKTAIARALRDLEHDDPAVFLRGISHIQLEPVWGGRRDSAPELRGVCGLALTSCRLPDGEVLTHLVDLLADPEKIARIAAARAIAQSGRAEGALLLRLKALNGDAEAEVAGECFAALLAMTGAGAVPFVSRFLRKREPAAMEAAGALAVSGQPEAFAALKEHWESGMETLERKPLLMLLAGSPLPEAAEFLLAVAEEEPAELAAAALEALATSRFRQDARERAAAAVARRGERAVEAAYRRHFCSWRATEQK
jgi:hypothetical protein